MNAYQANRQLIESLRAEAKTQATWIAERLGDGGQPVLPYVRVHDREIVASASRNGVLVIGTKEFAFADGPWYYTVTSGWNMPSETAGVQMTENHGQHSTPAKALVQAKQDWLDVIALAQVIGENL